MMESPRSEAAAPSLFHTLFLPSSSLPPLPSTLSTRLFRAVPCVRERVIKGDSGDFSMKRTFSHAMSFIANYAFPIDFIFLFSFVVHIHLYVCSAHSEWELLISLVLCI